MEPIASTRSLAATPDAKLQAPPTLDNWIGRDVVLDTQGPMVFLGTLRGVGPEGFWLENADAHDRSDGHATKEQYVVEARQHGIRASRRSILVHREFVISLSLLADVIVD